MFRPMKRILSIAAFLLFLAPAAHAACFAEYKAKKDNPLKLHIGVIELPANACSDRGAAERTVQSRISKGGWTLLNIVSIFDEGGLDQRKQSAGQFFLRF